jgi:hypothetical protein
MKSITLLFVFALSFSATAQTVTYDYDKDTDFTQFKTFSFGGWQDGSDKVINDIDKKRLLQSFKSEFVERGMQYELADADVYITLYIVVKNETSTTAYTNYQGMGGYGMGYGYGMGIRPGWGWGMGSATTTYSEDDYQEGTLVVDVYDTKTKKLVWQASGQQVVKSAQKRSKSIPKAVTKIMKKYPVAIPK